MRYGESAFDILYLLFALISGCIMLSKARNCTQKLMGVSALVLGAGDAFHLVPRILNYFVSSDMTSALGIGKLITSITMTVFYVLVYYIWSLILEKENKKITALVWILTAIRIALCILPQNGWFQNSNDMTWGIIRNFPFVILGAVICVLYFSKRKELGRLKFVWLYILLSFMFYIPVAVASGIVPLLGMLMLPKTVSYIIIIGTFLFYTTKEENISEDC